jgi:hypothetical protein
MSAGKYLSLEEVRRNPKLLGRFMKQHGNNGDLERFENALGSIVKAA